MSAWKPLVRVRAQEFIKESRKVFDDKLLGSIKLLPNYDQETLQEQLGIFLDAFTDLHVGVVAQNLNTSKQWEEFMVAGIRERFAQLRRKEIMEVADANKEAKKIES